MSGKKIVSIDLEKFSVNAKRYPGALYDLDTLIKTNLFLICPNNSGSTLLKGIFANSQNTWNLQKEGQHMLGFQGVSTNGTGAELLWATDKWLKYFSDEQAYNWPETKKAWYFTATSLSPDASVFFTKSPPAILWVNQLKQHFNNSKFIFMVRNPYAVVEGIARRKKNTISSREERVSLAAQHIMKCFELQRRNIETYKEEGMFFSYETLCNKPDEIAAKVVEFIPELSDLDMGEAIPVKGMYHEPVRNMNEQQVDMLSKNDLKNINRVFDQYRDDLDYFEYTRIN
jgi:hypothetical protein